MTPPMPLPPGFFAAAISARIAANSVFMLDRAESRLLSACDPACDAEGGKSLSAIEDGADGVFTPNDAQGEGTPTAVPIARANEPTAMPAGRPIPKYSLKKKCLR